MDKLLNWQNKLSRFSQFLGYTAAAFTILMILIVFIDVALRYFFNAGSMAMQELEWHCFAALFLLGTAYTLKENAHVRVDIFYDRMSITEKAYVNLFGILFFLIPFATILIYSSWDFVFYSFKIGESSPDPGGLPARYILKALIPLSYIFVLTQALSEIFGQLIILSKKESS